MIGAAVAMHPAPALADEVDDFAGALRPYLTDEFELAAVRFQALLAERSLTSPELVESVRRYYAATLVYLNRPADARAAMEQLLRESPEARIEPGQFSTRVVSLFEQTRLDLSAELRAIRERRREQRASEQSAQVARQRRLVDLLTREVVALRVPQWQMYMPLGIGQFANGDTGLGILFATTQIVGLVAAPVAVFAADALFPPLGRYDPPYGPGSAGLYDLLTVINVGGWTLFAASLATGVIQANVAYRAERHETRTRPLPPELGSLRLAVAPSLAGGLVISGGWRF